MTVEERIDRLFIEHPGWSRREYMREIAQWQRERCKVKAEEEMLLHWAPDEGMVFQVGKAILNAEVKVECPQCGGQGWYEVIGSAHAPDCDGSCKNCPVPVPEQEQCAVCEGTGYVNAEVKP